LRDGNTANGGNLFFSPYSISQALAMTYAGARAETETQMAATLRFVLAQEALHKAFNGLDQELASRGIWNLLEGEEITVSMMALSERLGYTSGKGYQAVELPYDGGELSMLVMLPDAGRFAEFEERLDASLLNQILDELAREQLQLTMPKFEFESEFSLGGTLSAMGMPIAFSDLADFSGMTGTPDLYISDVVHESFVTVDEVGTEAAAATGVIMDVKMAPAEPRRVAIDRPFIFLIRDIATGSVLFLGRVMKPAR
jgi:serpin B